MSINDMPREPRVGKSIAERVKEWFKSKWDVEVKFQNPANIKLGSIIKIDIFDYIDPLDKTQGLVVDLDFEVKEIQIYRRQDNKAKEWVDYLLEAETDNQEEVWARLRIQSRGKKELTPVFIQLWDTVQYDRGFQDVLEDCDKHKSLFSIDVLNESYTRCAGLGEPSQIVVTKYRDLDSDGKVTESEVEIQVINYRDFVLSIEGQQSNFLFIEQETDTMVSELWRGRRILFSEIHL